MLRLRSLLLLVCIWFPTNAGAETYLLMAEEAGCYWCGRWNAEIAPIYPKTPEGKAAPLRRFDLHGDAPDVQFSRRISFTPTFVLVRDGVEIDRIEGYPGEDFFWGLLAMMLEKASISVGQTG